MGYERSRPARYAELHHESCSGRFWVPILDRSSEIHMKAFTKILINIIQCLVLNFINILIRSEKWKLISSGFVFSCVKWIIIVLSSPEGFKAKGGLIPQSFVE